MNKEEVIQKYLEELDMTEEFSCLDIKDISIEKYKKGQYLFHAGDKVEAIYFLAEGKCRILNGTSGGKEIAIDDDIPKGRWIGEMEMAAEIDFFHSVDLAEDSVVLRIPIHIVEEKMMQHPPFLRSVCRQLGWELTQSGQERVRVGLLGAKTRVAQCLYERYMRTHQESFTISCKQTALECCVSVRHLNRIFHVMETEGLIARNRNHIRILDGDKLGSMEKDA
ncbi:MAG: Crp/Fnr family transcriptional regulator [Eubacteriales bacterium]|nr:Crp/Fnr family transcriptional regulator [Eubacteriales bacterium]